MSRFHSVALNSAGLLVTAVLTGCSVRPSVTYTKITPQMDPSTLTDSYFLQSSTITIKAADTAKGAADPSQADLQVTSTPTEFPNMKIGITSNKSWFGSVTTVVNITKIDNTALVKEIGSEISDKRADTIKTIGSIITTGVALIPFAAGELDPSKLPWTATTYSQIAKDPAGADAGKPLLLPDGVSMTLGPLPPDAKPIAELPTKASNSFLYAACRDAKVEFAYGVPDPKNPKDPGKRVTSKHTTIVKIADPRYYELVAFPIKGKITMHPACGVSVTTDKDTGVSTGVDIANALEAQGKAIKDAIDASKKTPAAK